MAALRGGAGTGIGRAMILLRHGQSQFNAAFTATRRDPGIPDPALTALGEAQARQAAEDLAGEEVRHIIASPYTRALQTAAPLARLLGIAVTVNPIVRERYAFSCDVGSPRGVLMTRWPELDFSRIEEVWWPSVNEPAQSVRDRAELFRAEMAALPQWRQTVVVSHWGFILGMTGVSVANGEWLRCDPTAAAPDAVVWKV
jgi:broad specificity phosphatase PhoE